MKTDNRNLIKVNRLSDYHDYVRGDVVSRSKYVPHNVRCRACGFPNYDYQVRADNLLCRQCEEEWVTEKKAGTVFGGWLKRKQNENRPTKFR